MFLSKVFYVIINRERSDHMNRIYTYKEYLIRLYGDKTYKLPIHIPVTCPNRDGTKGKGGCWFCSEQGTGFESEDSMTPISKQLSIAKEKVVKRYKAKHFIGYFQNYTNTYLPLSRLMEYLEEAKSFGLSGIDIATRRILWKTRIWVPSGNFRKPADFMSPLRLACRLPMMKRLNESTADIPSQIMSMLSNGSRIMVFSLYTPDSESSGNDNGGRVDYLPIDE